MAGRLPEHTVGRARAGEVEEEAPPEVGTTTRVHARARKGRRGWGNGSHADCELLRKP